MMACGEDLGMVPDCVPSVMDQLQILSLEIQRMPKVGLSRSGPQPVAYLSVCTTSTHDMSPCGCGGLRTGSSRSGTTRGAPREGPRPKNVLPGSAARSWKSTCVHRPCGLYCRCRTGCRLMLHCEIAIFGRSVSTCRLTPHTTGAIVCISHLSSSWKRRRSMKQ